jgi:hypothetical protein
MTLVYLLGGLPLAGMGFLTWRAVRIWIDVGRLTSQAGSRPGPARRLGWALWGALLPNRYWWGARIEAMPPDARQRLLAREAAALGLSHADAERCPLCGAEIPQAWTLDAEGRVKVAPGPVECPECDFQLDACRHCRYFLPGPPRSSFQLGPSEADITFGRCAFYKRAQPVEEAAAPDMARSLRQRGYDRIRAPMRITDSMLRPDSCRAFEPHRKRMAASDVDWPGPRRAALLCLEGAVVRQRARGEQRPAPDQERWLF